MPSRLNVDTETLTERYGKFFRAAVRARIRYDDRQFDPPCAAFFDRRRSDHGGKIEGVEHEFSSIKGVVEDATDVILNLKQVPFVLHGSGPKTLTISKKGAGEVTSADIEADADVEILDTEHPHRDGQPGRSARRSRCG